MRCAFENCGEAALAASKFCWDHLPDRESYKNMLSDTIRAGKSCAGCNLKKIVLRNAHIEKIDLSGANLSQADLSDSRLFDVNLKDAELIGANLSGCDLTHCNLHGADLTRAVVINARLWNTVLDNANLSEANLSEADFWNARLFNANLWHASLSGCNNLTRANFSKPMKFFSSARINESGEMGAEEAYRNLKRYFMSCGRYNDASWASFKEKTMERIILKKRWDINYIPSFFMGFICGYGEKPYRIVLSSILTIFAFAFLYRSFNTVELATANNYILSWSDYIYYSTITFTTVGYGDFIPRPVGAFRLLSALEAFTGVFLTGLFIFTLARKYSAR